jgi:para-aminobenzoate synthetase component 1
MLCRFEDRLQGSMLELVDFSHRITAEAPEQLATAFQEIEAAQAQGCWIALLLDYELGEWLEPAVVLPSPPDAPSSQSAEAHVSRPRLTALVYRHVRHAGIEPMPGADIAAAVTGTPVVQCRPGITRAAYMEHVEAIRAGIARGDFYQTNYTFPIEVETNVAPRDLYEAIAARHPAAHSAYIEDGTRRLLSFSPELFIARCGARLTVRPMKGTAPRHTDPQLDQQAADALLRSEKDRAENLMIVDLLRNDLGRVAIPGTVKVEALFTLERYPSVWTLTSTITAQAPHATLEALLRALFPCGSITGAPKIAAMQQIRQRETATRGIYCGSIGWLAPNGDCSLNVAIRSIEMGSDGRGIFGVGGGIVHDSDPELEWDECHWKARILPTQ